MLEPVNHSKLNILDFIFATKARRTYTNVAVSIVLIIVLVVFALRPTILTIGKIKDKIKAYEEVNSKIKAKVKSSQILYNQMNSSASPEGLKNEIEFMNKAFFKEEDLKTFYSNIYKRTNENGVAIKSLTPTYYSSSDGSSSDPKDTDTSSIIPSGISFALNLVLESKDLNSAQNFIKTIEGHDQFPIFSRVSSLNINYMLPDKNSENETSDKSKKVIKDPYYNINLTMMVYVDQSRYQAPVVPAVE